MRVWEDSGGYGRIWQEMQDMGGCGRICEGMGGYGKDMEGYGRIWKDMEGYGRIWEDMGEYERESSLARAPRRAQRPGVLLVLPLKNPLLNEKPKPEVWEKEKEWRWSKDGVKME